jgi:hypothetical protein
VCGVVVEEASREGGGRGFEYCRPCSGATLHKKMTRLVTGTGGWLPGGVPP